MFQEEKNAIIIVILMMLLIFPFTECEGDLIYRFYKYYTTSKLIELYKSKNNNPESGYGHSS